MAPKDKGIDCSDYSLCRSWYIWYAFSGVSLSWTTARTALSMAMGASAWKMLRQHIWPGNVRELQMVMHNVATFTLIGGVDAIRSGMTIRPPS